MTQTPTAPAIRRRRDRAPRPAPGTVLFVCTGNICRSAYGERALQERLDELARGRVDVGSVGTESNLRLRVPRPLVAAADAAGVPGMDRHRPTKLTAGIITEADLILAASEDHMRTVLRERPRAIAKTFTVRELGALARAMAARTDGAWPEPGIGVAGFAEEASRHRALARSLAGSLDIEDPYRGPDEGYAQMVELMAPDVEAVAQALARAVTPA